MFNQLLLLFLNYARYKRGDVYFLKIVKGEEWVKSAEYLFIHVMYCVSTLYVVKVKSEELIAIFLPTVLLLK